MTKRIFRSIFLTSLAALILASGFIVLTLYKISETDAVNALKSEAAYISSLIRQEQTESEHLRQIFSNDRITLIAENGAVKYDNITDASTMENHANRPEFREALTTGTGESRRFSDTLSQMTIYYALKTHDGNVLRISRTQSSVLGMLQDILPILLFILISSALLSYIIARYMAKQIVSPINALNLDSPFENDIYDELSPLLTRIDRQNRDIKKQMLEITKKQHEFNAVTNNMREGLILISAKGNILSINESAGEIFQADIEKSIGSHILTVNRSVTMQKVFEGALSGINTEALLSINSRHFQLLGSPVVSQSSVLGVVILLLDITDKHSAERSRREFSANVSHELKTPLTSILGFAEIMKEGLAKPEDMQGFAERIHYEASGLLTLIDDILELSQLDEKTELPDREHVDLFSLAENVLSRLKPIADKKGVNLTLQGEHVVVSGYEKILDGMLYNLCDNAIKYNVAGGNAKVTIAYKDSKPIVIVSDTGIGIPPEHRPHIFERFYRVNKSRSKEIGGTGLGLSIVKHGAILHDITIDMQSDENKGTTFTLTFPVSVELS
ncbi:MAG: PAS domain S-box protein [Clostridiales bacterium]|nr:PAS domain S-box protein [Clostridiales bacterium]